MNDAHDDKLRIRRRALRAARVATLGLVLAMPGCYLSVERPNQPDTVTQVDAGHADGGALADAGSDAGTDGGVDAGLRDCEPGTEGWAECCEAIDWDWDRGCAAWGPFVPPADGEMA